MIAQLADALRSLRRVLGNPELRRVELVWTLGCAAAAVVEARLARA